MKFLERLKRIMPDLRKMDERGKTDEFFPPFHLFEHIGENGSVVVHRAEDENFAVWARDDAGEPAVVTTEVLTALFRYLAGIVLPGVERKEITSRGDLTAFISESVKVHRVTNHVRLGGETLLPTQARALAACLLAAADEAEVGR